MKNNPEILLMQKPEEEARRANPPPRKAWPSSPKSVTALAPLRQSAGAKPGLSAKKLKVTVVLDPAELLTIAAVDGVARMILCIALPDRTVTADIATKSLRRAQKAITDTGTENVAVIVQGALVAGDKIADAGLSAQPKGPKPPNKVVVE